MKKLLLLLVALVSMVAGAFAQTNRPATTPAPQDTTKPAAAPTKTAPTPAQTKIATEKSMANSPDVILAEGNYFTGEVIVIGQKSKVFMTTQENVFVWLKDGKAVEIKTINPSIYKGMLMEKGFKVYDQWPMILTIKKEEFLVIYFATSGGGWYGLPDGTIMKEKSMKQSGVIRSQGLSGMKGVEKTNSLKKLIQQLEAAETATSSGYDY